MNAKVVYAQLLDCLIPLRRWKRITLFHGHKVVKHCLKTARWLASLPTAGSRIH